MNEPTYIGHGLYALVANGSVKLTAGKSDENRMYLFPDSLSKLIQIAESAGLYVIKPENRTEKAENEDEEYDPPGKDAQKCLDCGATVFRGECMRDDCYNCGNKFDKGEPCPHCGTTVFYGKRTNEYRHCPDCGKEFGDFNPDYQTARLWSDKESGDKEVKA